MGATAQGRWLLGLLVSVLVASAEESSLGQIRGRVSIPQKLQTGLASPQEGLAAAKIVIDGGEYAALPTADGYFVVSDIPIGPHLLQVVHPRLVFDPVRVEAQEVKGGPMKMVPYLADLEHGRGAKLKYPLGLAPSGTFQYLEKREEFNIMTIFKNPMALISLFSCGAMFLLPKLQPMIEEEKERQRLETEGKDKEGIQDNRGN